MEDTVTERIKFLIDEVADKPADFARATGLTNQNVYDLTSGRKGAPSYSTIKKILIAYPDVNERWLLLGEGIALKSDAQPKNNSVPSGELTVSHTVQEEKPAPYGNANLRVLTVQVGADGDENIEFVGVRAAAGYAQGGFRQPDFIEKLPSFRLPDAAYRNASFRCFQVSGDSMQSTLYAGDWVICKYVEQWDRDIRDNRVYIIVLQDGVVVKRLLNRINNRGNLSLLSDNPAYPIQFIDPAEVREIWEAVGKLSRQFINPRYDVSTELARHSATMEEMMQRLERLESRNS